MIRAIWRTIKERHAMRREAALIRDAAALVILPHEDDEPLTIRRVATDWELSLHVPPAHLRDPGAIYG